MLKSRLVLSAATVALLGLSTAARAEGVEFFTGLDLGPDSYFAYLGGKGSVSGRDMDTSQGWLVRGTVGYGEYDYKTALLPGTDVEGEMTAADLMVGHNFLFDGGSLELYGGGSYEDHDVSPYDRGNSVRGSEGGVKGLADLDFQPIRNVHIDGVASYASNYDSYWARLHAGYDFGPLTIGPEVSALGNDEYGQTRIGAGLYGVDLGFADLSAYAGVADSTGRRSDGAYGGIGFNRGF